MHSLSPESRVKVFNDVLHPKLLAMLDKEAEAYAQWGCVLALWRHGEPSPSRLNIRLSLKARLTQCVLSCSYKHALAHDK